MTQSPLLYNRLFEWDGWGGAFKLGSGQCHLMVYDLNADGAEVLSHLKPYLVVVSDLPQKKPRDMSVRSCAGHIATTVVRRFEIDPQRMTYVEYYPASVYGVQRDHHIPERFDQVLFTWRENRAYEPLWEPLAQPLMDCARKLVGQIQLGISPLSA